MGVKARQKHQPDFRNRSFPDVHRVDDGVYANHYQSHRHGCYDWRRLDRRQAEAPAFVVAESFQNCTVSFLAEGRHDDEGEN